MESRLPPGTMTTPPRRVPAAAAGGPYGPRGHAASPPTPLMNANSYRSMILLEKKRKAHEVAADDLNNALLQETLAGLRKKADALQQDKWMFQDVAF